MFALIPLSFLFGSKALGQGPETDLARVFTKGDKYNYEFRSTINIEARQRGLATWLPEDQDINYDFSWEVENVKNEGIAVIRYKRPTMTIILGETAESAPKPTVEKTNIDQRITMSPYFEVIDSVDLSPKKPRKNGEPKEDTRARTAGTKQSRGLQAFLGGFVQEVFRIALCVGSFDNGLDFAPRTPYEPVKVGETWKRTVGYSPQKLQGKGGKMDMQRLDYTYTFKGLVEQDGKKVLRVDAKLAVNSDLAAFVHQISGLKPEQTNLKKAPLLLDAKLEFDLDPTTKQTIAARGESVGGFTVVLNDFEEPVEELKFKGHPTLRLASKTKATTPAAPRAKPVKKKKG